VASEPVLGEAEWMPMGHGAEGHGFSRAEALSDRKGAASEPVLSEAEWMPMGHGSEGHGFSRAEALSDRKGAASEPVLSEAEWMPMGHGSEGHGFSRAEERALLSPVCLDCEAIKANRSSSLRKEQTISNCWG